MAWRTGRVAKPAGLAALYYKVLKGIVLQTNTEPGGLRLYYKVLGCIVLQSIRPCHKRIQCICQGF